MMKEELKDTSLTWGTALKTAQDRRAWKVIIEASCITSHDEIR